MVELSEGKCLLRDPAGVGSLELGSPPLPVVDLGCEEIEV
jgi:hypothetical protein